MRERFAKRPVDAPDVAPAVGKAERLATLNRGMLEELGRTAFARGYDGQTTVLLCLAVESSWRWLVNRMMPGYDWGPLIGHQRQDEQSTVMASGFQPREWLTEILVEHGIDIGAAFEDPPAPPGSFWVLVGFDAGLGMVLLDVPPPDQETCEDHDRAAMVVFVVVFGRLPGWTSDEATFLATVRGCSLEEAQTLTTEIETLQHVLGVEASARPRLVVQRLVADLLGWDEQRARIALQTAVHAGLLEKGGQPTEKPS